MCYNSDKSSSNREKARQALRAAGLLAEPSQPTPKRTPSITLEEVNAIFARVGGKPLSEIVIEQRGPKI